MKRVVVLAFALAACHARGGEEREEPVAVAVRCVPAAKQKVNLTVTLRGRVAPPPGEDLPLSSQVPGRVVELKVAEGTRIGAGEVVAVVDDSTSRDALRQAQAGVTQAKASSANAEATLTRVKALVARGIAASQELDDAEANAKRADAAVHAAEAASSGARRTLGRVKVKSSFAGTVTKVWRGAGALVDGTAATPIVQLAATELELAVDATDRQLVDIQPEQKAKITLSSAGAELTGVVRARPTALEPATGLGVVRIALSESDPRPLVGTFGMALIDEGHRDGVLVVPDAALRGAAADGAEIVVCKDQKAEIRPVKIGWRDAERVEIVSGLVAGERVAIDHVLGLESGSPITEAP
jgi:membrane fusion protein, multidrug efflux system